MVRYVFLRPLRPELDGQDVEARNSKSSKFLAKSSHFPEQSSLLTKGKPRRKSTVFFYFIINHLLLYLQPTVARSASYYMEQGHWFLSVYNDDIDSQEVSFLVKISEELTKNCPNGCHGRGECVLGRCQCESGYDGPDCGQSKLPFCITSGSAPGR
jgi:hypothetical protein